jgi:hypothetical protein
VTISAVDRMRATEATVRERSFVHKGSRRLEYLTPLQLLHYSAKLPHVRQIAFACAYVVRVA